MREIDERDLQHGLADSQDQSHKAETPATGHAEREAFPEFAMSKFLTKEQRLEAINRKIDSLAKKRDYAFDVMGNELLGYSYQMDIDKLVTSLDA